jgi:vacuolar-type H+-ATPase subunit C/Vma6
MATIHPKAGTGNLIYFNIQHGYAEALIRGMRSSFLADPDYHHLTQCETLDDVRLNMTETDYSEALEDYNSLTPNTLQKAAVDKVRSRFVESSPWRRHSKFVDAFEISTYILVLSPT